MDWKFKVWVVYFRLYRVVPLQLSDTLNLFSRTHLKSTKTIFCFQIWSQVGLLISYMTYWRYNYKLFYLSSWKSTWSDTIYFNILVLVVRWIDSTTKLHNKLIRKNIVLFHIKESKEGGQVDYYSVLQSQSMVCCRSEFRVNMDKLALRTQ